MSNKFVLNIVNPARLYMLFILINLVGCQPVYKGDGKLIDHGFMVGADRYILDLKTIDTTTISSEVFLLEGLPRVRMTIGFNGGFLDKKEPNLPEIHLRLRDLSEMRTLINVKDNLREWVWGGVPQRGETFIHYWKTTNSFRKDEEDNGHNDSVKGSTFIPVMGHKYDLLVEVITPTKKSLNLKLQLTGGGTKSPD